MKNLTTSAAIAALALSIGMISPSSQGDASGLLPSIFTSATTPAQLTLVHGQLEAGDRQLVAASRLNLAKGALAGAQQRLQRLESAGNAVGKRELTEAQSAVAVAVAGVEIAEAELTEATAHGALLAAQLAAQSGTSDKRILLRGYSDFWSARARKLKAEEAQAVARAELAAAELEIARASAAAGALPQSRLEQAVGADALARENLKLARERVAQVIR